MYGPEQKRGIPVSPSRDRSAGTTSIPNPMHVRTRTTPKWGTLRCLSPSREGNVSMEKNEVDAGGASDGRASLVKLFVERLP